MPKNKTVIKRAAKKGGVEELPIPRGKGEAKLEKKKAELLKAKEIYYRLCREFIELWTKTKRAQRQD